jgi:hypothetical protein
MSEKEDKTLRFSLKLEDIPVILTGKDGVEEHYTIEEMDGGRRDAYLNRQREKAEFDDAGKVTEVHTFEGSQSTLLSLCMRDDKGKLVPEDVIQSFPSHVLEALHEAAQKLNETETPDAENDSKKELSASD